MSLESVRYDRSEMDVALASSQLNAVIDIEMTVGEMIHSQKITSGSIVAIARANHPIFADGGATVSLDDYMALRHVAVSTRPQGASFEDITFARSTVLRRNIAARCQSISSALQLVRQTDIVITIAEPFLDEIEPRRRLAHLPDAVGDAADQYPSLLAYQQRHRSGPCLAQAKDFQCPADAKAV